MTPFVKACAENVDDWSLNGKVCCWIEREINSGWSIPNITAYFLKSDIDILRLKLIEDIQSIPNEDLHLSWKRHIGVIINKRFGVD